MTEGTSIVNQQNFDFHSQHRKKKYGELMA